MKERKGMLLRIARDEYANRCEVLTVPEKDGSEANALRLLELVDETTSSI